MDEGDPQLVAGLDHDVVGSRARRGGNELHSTLHTGRGQRIRGWKPKIPLSRSWQSQFFIHIPLNKGFQSQRCSLREQKFSLLLRNNPKIVPLEPTGLGLIFLNGLINVVLYSSQINKMSNDWIITVHARAVTTRNILPRICYPSAGILLSSAHRMKRTMGCTAIPLEPPQPPGPATALPAWLCRHYP